MNSILLAAPADNSGLINMIMMVAIFAIFYFFMIRPQSQKQKKVQNFRNSMLVGDQIVTAGGIYGKIKEIKDNIIVVEIANNVCIRVDKNSIYPEVEPVNK